MIKLIITKQDAEPESHLVCCKGCLRKVVAERFPGCWWEAFDFRTGEMVDNAGKMAEDSER